MRAREALRSIGQENLTSPRIPRTASLGYRRKGAEPWLLTVASPSGSTADVATRTSKEMSGSGSAPKMTAGGPPAAGCPTHPRPLPPAGGFDGTPRLSRPAALSRPTTLTHPARSRSAAHARPPGAARPFPGERARVGDRGTPPPSTDPLGEMPIAANSAALPLGVPPKG